MNVNLLDYSAALKSRTAEELVSYSVRLSILHSFREWKALLLENFRSQILSLPGVSHELVRYFYNLLDCDATVGLMSGPCRNLIFHWPSGEPKLLHIWNDELIITDNTYWLNSFGFLGIDAGMRSCKLTDGGMKLFKEIEDSDSTISITHNNHFGHFIVDNLPLLSLLDGPMYTHIKHANALYSTYNPKQVIKELLQKTCPTLNYKLRSDLQAPSFNRGSYTFKSRVNYQIISSSILCNAYLIDQYSKSVRKKEKTNSSAISANQVTPRNIFLVRGNNYLSRVSNIGELKRFLERNDFLIVDPTLVSLDKLEQILYSSELVIAESGSTTLNALWFCANTCRIVSLVSDEIIHNTSTPMIHGGLPYILPFLNRINIFIGESVTYSQTQSSNTCVYDCMKLAELLESL